MRRFEISRINSPLPQPSINLDSDCKHYGIGAIERVDLVEFSVGIKPHSELSVSGCGFAVFPVLFVEGHSLVLFTVRHDKATLKFENGIASKGFVLIKEANVTPNETHQTPWSVCKFTHSAD